MFRKTFEIGKAGNAPYGFGNFDANAFEPPVG